MDKEQILESLNEKIIEQGQEKLANVDFQKELQLNNPNKGMLDIIQEKIISRKLLVFICATALLSSAQLDPETWGMIAMIYIGGQTAVDFAKMWRHGG
jgi:hypothetical protein